MALKVPFHLYTCVYINDTVYSIIVSLGSGWFLDKVVIKEGAESDHEFLFECDRWLDEGEDDSKVERVLHVAHEASAPKEGSLFVCFSFSSNI